MCFLNYLLASKPYSKYKSIGGGLGYFLGDESTRFLAVWIIDNERSNLDCVKVSLDWLLPKMSLSSGFF